MIIKPFIGIDDLRLGSTMKQAFDYIGGYDEHRTWAYDIYTSQIWKHKELGIELVFYNMDGYHLSQISTSSPKTEFKGINPIGKSEQELLALFPSIRTSDNPGDYSKSYYLDKWGLSFSVIEGKVESVTIFPLYDENAGDVRWPSHLAHHL